MFRCFCSVINGPWFLNLPQLKTFGRSFERTETKMTFSFQTRLQILLNVVPTIVQTFTDALRAIVRLSVSGFGGLILAAVLCCVKRIPNELLLFIRGINCRLGSPLTSVLSVTTFENAVFSLSLCCKSSLWISRFRLSGILLVLSGQKRPHYRDQENQWRKAGLKADNASESRILKGTVLHNLC